MKQFLFFLIIIILFSCSNKKNYNEDDLKFKIRKYIISENLEDLNNFNNYTLTIDSIIKFPKYIFIESELESNRKIYIRLEKNNYKYKHEALKFVEKTIDSLNEIYKNINKDIKYNKCYITIKTKTNPILSNYLTFILDENFNVVKQDILDF